MRNTTHQARKRWINLFAGYEERVELVYLELPLPVIFRRNADRAGPIPLRAIERLVEKLVPPTWGEAHSLSLDAPSSNADPKLGCEGPASRKR